VVLTAGSPILSNVTLGISSFSSAFDSFLTAWDLFRFDRIEVIFTPGWQTSSTGTVPMIAAVRNYDDSSAPASFDAVAGAGGSVLRLFNRPVRLRCSAPALLTPANATGSAVTNGIVTIGQWLNPAIVTITNMLVPLVKYAVSAVAVAPGGGTYWVNIRIHLSLAQPVMG